MPHHHRSKDARREFARRIIGGCDGTEEAETDEEM